MNFEDRVLEKLDEIQATQGKHGERLATLEERSKGSTSSLLKTSGITVSGGAVGALLSFLAQHWKNSP